MGAKGIDGYGGIEGGGSPVGGVGGDGGSVWYEIDPLCMT